MVVENVKLSVIVPVFNVEKYIEKCVESILAQTYRDFEILLIDDGSTDSSLRICEQIKLKDSRIRLFIKKNGGQASARNLGLKNAKGEYISFVDSDDFIHPRMFEVLIGQIEATGSDISVCSFQRCSPDAAVEEYCSYESADFDIYLSEDVIRNYWHFAQNILKMSPWNKIYRKELFKDNGFHEGIIYEDHFILPSLIERSKQIVVTNAPLYYYVQSPNSTMRSSFSAKRLDALFVWRCGILPFLEKRGSSADLETARNYFLEEFRNLSFSIFEYSLGNSIKIESQYKALYNKLMLSPKSRIRDGRGKYSAFINLLSLFSMRLAYYTGKRLNSKKFHQLWEKI